MSVLRPEAFEKLLSALAPDRQASGEAYEELRLRLVRFFRWEGCHRAEDAADETLDRVAAKLLAGETILNPAAYAGGVARLVLKELLRHQNREQPRQVLDFPAPAPKPPDALEQNCFDRCFDTLDRESRVMLLDYYRGDASARIRNRQAMAARAAISLNSLRNRALRLREKLERCVHACLEDAGKGDE